MSNIKFQIITVILAVIATISALIFINHQYRTTAVSIPKFSHQTKKETHQQQSSSSIDTLYVIPDTLYLRVPFTPQAPTANWDQLHNEACEEASAIMAYEYFSSSTDIALSSKFVEYEIAKLTEWQDKNFGYHLDTSSAETAQMISQVYGLQIKLIDNFTADEIKKELVQNHLVIISEYGRALGNPYYKQPGPIHHMLLIKGFDGANFITNDSGTKRGLNYIYAFDTIYSAAGDWDHSANNVDLSKKIAIAVWK